MSDPGIITNLLGLTMVGDTNSIKQAEVSLENLYQDPNFIPHLLLIPKESSIPSNVHKAAVIYTLKYARTCVINKDQTKINALSEHLLNFLAQKNLDLSLRRHVAVTLQYILMKDRQFIIRNILTSNFLDLLSKASIQNSSTAQFQFLGLVAQILIGSADHVTKELMAFIQGSFNSLININVYLFSQSMEILKSSENRHKNIECLRILRIYSSVFKLYMRKIVYSDIQTVKMLYQQNIAQLISASLNITLPYNELSSPILYFKTHADSELVDYLHNIKADYMAGLGALKRTLLQHFKQPRMLEQNAILQSPIIIPSLINAVGQLLCKLPYNLIKSQSLIKLLQQSLNVLIVSVRKNHFYKIFNENKQTILYACIFKILEFSDNDYQSLLYEPDQFINEVLQIIDMDPTDFIKNRKNQHIISNDEQGVDQEVQNYSTLRTVGATLLEAFCSNIDGTITEIFTYVLGVLEGTTQTDFKKSLLLMLIGILTKPASKRQGMTEKVCLTLIKVLMNRQIPGPLKQTQDATYEMKQSNIQYAMLLILLFKYLPNLKSNKDVEILPPVMELVCHILNKQDAPEGIKCISYDLIITLCSMKKSEEAEKLQFGLKFIEILNVLANSPSRNLQKVLQALYDLFKLDKQCETFAKNLNFVVGTVQNMVQIIYKQMENKTLANHLFVNKAWNIITDITQNDLFIPALIPQIEQLVKPLLPFIDEKFQFDYEQNILMMMSSFIKKAEAVTENQLLMFDMIPRLFYGQYDRMFVHAFETLQIFMFYGSNILSTAPQAIKTIISMGITSMQTLEGKNRKRNEGQNCEGLLIIQSLILCCGNSFTHENWIQIIKAVTWRLENAPVKTNILKSNLYACILLVLMVGNKFLTPEDIDLLLNQVLQNYNCFTVKYSIKVAIVCFAQLITYSNQPYILNRLPYLLDTLLCLLQTYEDQSQLFDRDAVSDEQKDYDACLSTTINSIIKLNQIEHVKNKLLLLKSQNPQALQEAVMQLPNKRKQFLQRSVMSMAKVNNETRKIFKIRAPQSK